MGAQHSHSGEDANQVTFQDFQILRNIGKGSFGKVCIVQKRDNKRHYAMKYMKKTKCLEKDAFRNVVREIDILAELNHPFLVNLWYTFQDTEDLFMVFDLLLGGDLRYHLNNAGRFSEDRVKLYACEIALALDYLQGKHILHRDIKPDNIVLDDNGHAHITDFNIATFLNQDCLATSLTGTRPYIAPEIYSTSLKEYPGYSYAVDWWSLGICFYEMMRGRRPFDIHAEMTDREARDVLIGTTVAIPVDWTNDLISFLGDLINLNCENRISNLDKFNKHPYMERIKMQEVLRQKMVPVFRPPQDSLNCDPTFELEEMIIESKPLHKKKKRLVLGSKSASRSEPTPPDSPSPFQEALHKMEAEFKLYNREELLKDEEERIRKLEKELGIRPPFEVDAIAKRLGRSDEEPEHRMSNS